MSTLSIDERRAVCCERGTTRTVAVGCVGCGRNERKPYSHDTSDLEIARKCFPGWQVKNVRGAKKTLCPKCRP